MGRSCCCTKSQLPFVIGHMERVDGPFEYHDSSIADDGEGEEDDSDPSLDGIQNTNFNASNSSS